MPLTPMIRALESVTAQGWTLLAPRPTINTGGWLTAVAAFLVLGGGLAVCIWIAAHHRVATDNANAPPPDSANRAGPDVDST